MYIFATAEWVDAFKAAINTNTAYRESAKSWEGDFWFIVDSELPEAKPKLIYLDLWHGECREAFVTQDETLKTPAFSIRGTLSKWEKVANREMDPIKALITGALKVTGNMAKLMRNVKAAQDLVNCATLVPTDFN